MHGHYLSPLGMHNVVLVWRDSRDIVVSWYHHCLFFNEVGNAPLVERCRKDLPFEDYENVGKNLPVFIEYAFTRQPYPRFSWTDFARRWHARKGVVCTHYESMNQDAAGTLRQIVFDLTGDRLSPERADKIVEEFSFTRQSGRRVGEESKSSFMRKG